MTLEDLKECKGYTVQVSINGTSHLYDWHLSDMGEPYILIENHASRFPFDNGRLLITEEDAKGMRLNGDTNLFSLFAIEWNQEGWRRV